MTRLERYYMALLNWQQIKEHDRKKIGGRHIETLTDVYARVMAAAAREVNIVHDSISLEATPHVPAEMEDEEVEHWRQKLKEALQPYFPDDLNPFRGGDGDSGEKSGG